MKVYSQEHRKLVTPVSLLALGTGYVESASLGTLVMRQTMVSFSSVEAALLHIGASIYTTSLASRRAEVLTRYEMQEEVIRLMGADNDAAGDIGIELFEAGWTFGFGWPHGKTHRKDLKQLVDVFENAEVLIADAYFGPSTGDDDECCYSVEEPNSRLNFWKGCIDAPRGVHILRPTNSTGRVL